MILKDFIDKFVGCNSLVRLWKINNNKEHQMLCDATMEWKILDNSKYKDYKVLYVKDILVDDFYREAINIVIDIGEDIYI